MMVAGGAQRGFTLLELMVAFAIVALLIGLAVPMGARMYDTMKYRDAIREINAAAMAARYRAITGGQPMDFLLHPDRRVYAIKAAGEGYDLSALQEMPGGDDLRISVISAEEVSPGAGVAAIRFYPEGGSTGGSISLQRANGDGIRLRVDWLLGSISEEALEKP